jgi:hypothetical protein
MTDTAKVHVRRKSFGQIDELGPDFKPTGKKVENKVTAFSYNDAGSPSSTTFVADPAEDEFYMTPEQAIAAVESGGFEVHPDSKSALEDQGDTAPLESPAE